MMNDDQVITTEGKTVISRKVKVGLVVAVVLLRPTSTIGIRHEKLANLYL